MIEFLTQYGWLIMCVIVTGLLVGWAWWFCAERAKLAARAGYALVASDQYKRDGEELIALRKLNQEFEREIASLKDKPAGPRVKPVIDWIGMRAIYTDYDFAACEFEIGWLDGKGDMGHSTLYDVTEEQARELNEDFKQAIRNKHQPEKLA